MSRLGPKTPNQVVLADLQSHQIWRDAASGVDLLPTMPIDTALAAAFAATTAPSLTDAGAASCVDTS